MDDEFLANPNGFESGTNASMSRVGGRGIQTSRTIKLRAGVDFAVVGENAVIITLPEAGDHVIETRQCSNYLHRTKFIRFSGDTNRRRAKRCVQRRRNLSIQTRLHNSGSKGCEIINIHQWNGPVIPAELEPGYEIPADIEPAPIVLE